MPAYNEEGNIEQAVRDVQQHVLSIVPGSQLVVVDDGSKDATGSILDNLAGADNRIVVLHRKNSGHGPSLLAGMQASAGDYIFLIDSDRQIPLDCFPALWQAAQTHDAVFGTRRNRQDPLVRLCLSRVIGVFMLLLFATAAPDVNAPCKLFRRKIWQEFHAAIPADDILAPSIMLNIFTRRHGYTVENIAVAHGARTQGEGSLKLGKLIRFCFNGLKQLIYYRSRLV
jgi:glycosyltransferase involved in cell wall biosynthesis